MKSKYLILGILALVLVIAASIYFYNQNSQWKETLYGYKVGNSSLITSTSFSNLNEESAKTTAEEALKISEEAFYLEGCLIFSAAEKRMDTRTEEEFWSVGFSCNEECSKIYLNCGAGVMIKNNYEVLIDFPN
ncbi:MAG: hypothetical protein KKE50_02925 [Nanoarchaeota archaeon]|nr:hypothetical protein [Nanoarchaeota archaeon]